MLESDPVGAGWTPAARRAPNASSGWGWTSERVKATTTPTLIVSGEKDEQVKPERARDFYTDLGSSRKVFVNLLCTSHNAMWERNHMILFKASLEWLEKTTVNGNQNGELTLGE
jgi:alpha-beta hydrolase superfamily lysophospholipase